VATKPKPGATKSKPDRDKNQAGCNKIKAGRNKIKMLSRVDLRHRFPTFQRVMAASE
jgi:hypothetical protein